MKIKNILVIVCMYTVLIGCAQNNSALKINLQLLQKSPEFQFPIDSTGSSKVSISQFYTERGSSYDDFFTLKSKNIHFVDFNNDGNNDIIYQDTQHYQATILFVKKGDKFIEIWSGSGKLIEVSSGKETTIYVAQHSVGCSSVSGLIKLIVHKDNTITQSFLYCHNKIIIKNINTTFKQIKISGILRTQPILDNKDKIEPCNGGLLIGNQIRTIENKVVIIIKKQKEWLLVIDKIKDSSIIAWIKK
ncbi:MAG: hypothetical protein HRT73_10150 [Flavobacteriales bacterium]|nr:hypothetical protein [Flavobacteriales bacterium]